MAEKSGMERIADAAHIVKALKDIIKAFLNGGWQSAALQVLKHYWLKILAVTLVVIMLPIIIFCCLPSIMFGFTGSTDAEINALNEHSSNISSYYDRYPEYCSARIETIKSSVAGNSQCFACEIQIIGEAMAKSWFIALYSVSCENDLNNMSEESIKEFISKSIVYSLEESEEKTEFEEDGDAGNTKILKIQYLTPLEFMSKYNFSASDRNWAQLIYRTIQGEITSVGGILDPPFSVSNWQSHITSGYGYRINPKPGFHRGLDIGMPQGTEILAVKSGIVKSSQNGTEGYGNHIIIDHGDGLETLYAHCSELLVHEGETVEAGAVIAKVGSTGNSTGPHLHIEIRLGGENLDPLAYLS